MIMKLLYCTYCQDFLNLGYLEKICSCGRVKGRYTDDLNALHNGNGITIGIANDSFARAIRDQPECGMGKEFTAFVIPKQCATFAVE